MSFFKILRAAGAVQKAYFKENRNEIAVRNLQMIRMASMVGIVVVAGFYAFTGLFFRAYCISPLYALSIPVLIGFYIYARLKQKEPDEIEPADISVVTILLYAVLTAYMIVMSVFPHPDIPSIYYHVFIIAAPVLFILPVYQQVLMTFVSLPVFGVLAVLFKSPECRSHELFEVAVSALVSLIVILFLTQYRSQTENLKAKYYFLSRVDTLTGTLNKTSGEEALRAYLEKKPVSERFAVLFTDIDDFKGINDTYGHLEGDRLLHMIGARLITLCRKNDIISRFGGDEFTILLKDVNDVGTAKRKAQAIVEAIRCMDFQLDKPITCSVGIYFGDGAGVSADEVIHFADNALYTVKNSGKNHFEVYNRK